MIAFDLHDVNKLLFTNKKCKQSFFERGVTFESLRHHGQCQTWVAETRIAGRLGKPEKCKQIEI